MKNSKISILAGAMLALTFTTEAQITLQHTYNNAELVQVVNLQLSGKKYCASDMTGGQVRLYNLNHTLWKTINFPTIPGRSLYTGYPAQYVSENLFNIDNKVNLVLTYTNTATSIYCNVIIDETGAVIKTIDTSQHLVVSNVGLDSFVAVCDMHVMTAVYPTYKVYSLPGTIPCNICGNGLGLGMPVVDHDGSGASAEVVPNPNSGVARIDYSLPTGTKQGQIEIYNTNGQKVNSYTVDRTFNYITVDNTMLPSGTYYYQLVVDGTASSAKQMVIVK